MSLHSWPGLSDCGRGCQALWGADSSAPFLTSPWGHAAPRPMQCPGYPWVGFWGSPLTCL